MNVPYRLRVPKRLAWGAVILAGVLTMGFLFTLGIQSVLHIPERVLAEMEQPAWRALDVRTFPFREKEDFIQAERRLSQRLDTSDSKLIPYFLRGALYQALGNDDKAQRDFGALLKLSNQNAWKAWEYSRLIKETKARLAFIYYKNNFEDLSKKFMPTLEKQVTNEDTPLMVALSDRLDFPERADFHFNLAKELALRFEIEKAREELKLAQSLVQNPQLAQEIQNYRQTQIPRGIVRLSPMLRYYSSAAAYYQHEKEDIQLAIFFLKKAIALAPEFEWLHSELALAYRKKQEFEAAKRHALIATQLNTSHYHAYLTLGDLALDEAQYPLAISHFRQAQGIMHRLPDGWNQKLHSNVHNQIGYSFECMRQWEAARHNYRLALREADSREELEAFMEYRYAQDALERVALHLKKPAPMLSQGTPLTGS